MYKLIRQGEFPQPVQKTDGTVGWIEEEVEGWIQDRQALRRGSPVRKAPIPVVPFSPIPATVPQAVVAAPKIIPKAGQPTRANIQGSKQLPGKSNSRQGGTETEFFFDAETGKLWVCIMTVDLPGSFVSG
jgi:hypothetical protein